MISILVCEISIISILVHFWSKTDNCIHFHDITLSFVNKSQDKVTEFIPTSGLRKDETSKIFKCGEDWELIPHIS